MIDNPSIRNLPHLFGGVPSTFQSDLNPKNYLIEPCNRLQIVIALVSISIIVLWGIGFTQDLLNNLLSHHLSKFNNFARDTVYGLLTGGIWGGAQWYFLRRYIPDPNWILATAVGWGFFLAVGSLTQEAMQAYSSNLLNPTSAVTTVPPLFPLIISGMVLGNLISLLAMGFFQWLLLRRYAKSANGWIFLPLVVLLFSLPMVHLQDRIQQTFLPLPICDVVLLRAGLWGLLPAIYLCTLFWHRDQIKDLENSTASLVLHPEIQQFATIRNLRLNLLQKLHGNWDADLSSETPLIYLVGLSRQGEILTYKAADSIAAQGVNQTPLSVMLPQDGVFADPSIPLARFQLSFSAPSHLEVRSLQGLPLWTLGGIVFLLLLLISCYPLWWLLIITSKISHIL